MQKLFTASFFAILILTSSLASAALPKIRIGTEGAYKPFNYINQKGQLLGFDVDIARALCKEMKRECEFVTQDWDGMIPALMMKKFDAIVASMSITEKRKKKVDFTDRYYSTPAKFVVPKDSKLEISKVGLKGKIIGVQRSTVHATYLEGVYKGIVTVKQYDTQESANLDLNSGRVDAVLADSAVMYQWMKDHGQGRFKFVGPDLNDPKWFGIGAGIAVRKNQAELVASFNKALVVIKGNGTYDRIRKKYFPFDIK